MTEIVYDKNGDRVPSREFLSTVIILLRKAEAETDMSFIQWLESFEQADVEVYDDDQLRSAIYKLMQESYPDKPKQFDPADWVDEDDEDMPTIEPMKDQETKQIEATLDGDIDDEEDLPPVIRLSEDE